MCTLGANHYANPDNSNMQIWCLPAKAAPPWETVSSQALGLSRDWFPVPVAITDAHYSMQSTSPSEMYVLLRPSCIAFFPMQGCVVSVDSRWVATSAGTSGFMRQPHFRMLCQPLPPSA